MIAISLTDFVDFISTSGTTRLVCVRDIANRGEYHPSKDFYKQVREIIIENCRAAATADDLTAAIATIRNPAKAPRHSAALRGMAGFMRRRRTRDWFEPPSGEWIHRDLRVRVNPEAGFVIDGKPHTLKLYFKDDPIARREASVVNYLMRAALTCDKSMRFGVVDVPRSRMLTHSARGRLEPLLTGEAELFVSLYRASCET